MESTRPLNPSTCDDINEFLERCDRFIVALAREKVPRNILAPEMWNMEIDELAQNVRIKLWLAAREKTIDTPKAYIRQIILHEVVNLVRQYKLFLQLPLNEDGELILGTLLVTLSREFDDPMRIVEQKEALDELLKKLIDAVLTLPPRQKHVEICSLKEKVDDVIHLLEAFRDREVEVGSVQWPADEADRVRLKASKSPAQRKVAEHMGIDISEYQRRGVSDTPLLCVCEDDT